MKLTLFSIFLFIGLIGYTQPSNDNCGAATTLTQSAYGACTPTSGTVLGATASSQANGCSGTADDDVWYKFVATSTSGNISLSNITGSTTDMYFSVYSGSCASLGTALLCSDPEENVVTSLTVGNTYYIRVFTYTSTTGQTSAYNICVTKPPLPPANDNCAAATTLIQSAYGACSPVAGTVAGATASTPASACSGTSNDDVWYKFVATSTTGNISLTNITGSTTDMYFAVYSGACGSLGTALLCSDPEENIVTGLTIGNTYFIRVYTYTSSGGQTSAYNICVTKPPPPPVNDNCATATSLTQYAYGACTPVAGTVAGATTSSQANGCSGTADDDVWYKFTATSTSANISLSNITGSTSDMYFSVYSGACGSLGTALLCSDPEQNIVTGLTVGNVYYIRVYTYTSLGGQTSAYNICVTKPPPPPVNDDCTSATTIIMSSDANCVATNGYVTGGTQTYPVTTGCGGTPNDDVWYKFVAVNDSAYISRTANFDSYLQVRTNCGSGAAGSLLCVDVESSQLLTGLTVGTTYYYRIYSYSSYPPTDGSFTTCVTSPAPPPPNGLCPNMVPICSDAPTSYFNNGGGINAEVTQPGNNYGCLYSSPNPVWYYIKIANAGNMSINLTGSADVDFALWGPYNSQTLAKVACGTLPLPIACSFSGSATEQINHTGCLVGEIYILLVTNFANVPQNISLVSSGSNTATTDCSIVTLPVELIDFTVKQAGMSVQVNWKTGSELNNDYFTVEKSMNGSIWSQIAKVKGAGTTNQLNEYSALDDKPFTGISYYRIKQTDFNGDFQYTNVEKVEFKGTESILVYPQPAKDKLTLVWDGFDGDITWMDFSGQIVNVPTQKSKNGSYIADVSQLQRGIYFIKLSDGKSVITKKITIQ